MSRSASGKSSRPSSARATPELKAPEAKTDADLTDPHKIDEKVETQVIEKTEDQSKEIEPKAVETKLPEPSLAKVDNEADKSVPKQETNTEPISTKPGRQKSIKMKKPTNQRQRPGGKTTNSTKTDKPPIIGGYIPQEEAKKAPESVQDSEVKAEYRDVPDVSVPDIMVEAELSQIVDEPLKEGSGTEELLESTGLAVEMDTGTVKTWIQVL